MSNKSPSIAKITAPVVSAVVPRERLFHLLDTARERPVVWVTGPVGSGKTTLVAGWLDSRRLPGLWYQLDEGDADIPTFFYYMGLAAKKAAPRQRKPLPLLTPEYLLGLPTFTKRYFEELYSRLYNSSKPPLKLRGGRVGLKSKRGMGGVIVLDNYQEAADPAFHEMINCGLEVVPQGLTVIVISRQKPPPQLSRLQANNRLSLLGWNELRLNMDETGKLSQMKSGSALSEDRIQQLYANTEGWAAGLVLLMELARQGLLPKELKTTVVAGEIFEYFASELLEKTDKTTRDFLLKSAFLPEMTVQMAEELTGHKEAQHILSRLERHNFFLTRRSLQLAEYQYHQLFREFLLLRATMSFTPELLSELRKSSAGILIRTGQPEQAAGLFIEAGDWEGLIQIILSQALPLIMQGRNKPLESWLTALPREMLYTVPWLLYWLGVCRLPFGPLQARSSFEQAFKLIEEQKDPAGVFLPWAGIIDSFVIFWQDLSPLPLWVDRLYELLGKYKAFPSPEIEARVTCNMFAALSHNQPHHPDMGLWAGRARALMQASPENNLRIMTGCLMINYYSWIGDYAKMTVLVEELRQAVKAPEVTALSQLWACLAKAIYCWIGGSFDACLEAVEKGSDITEASGIHILDSFLSGQAVYASCLRGDYAAARDWLGKTEKALNRANALELSHYLFQCAFLALARGDNSLAIEQGERSLEIVRTNGVPFSLAITYIVLANAYIEIGAYEKAEGHLAGAAAIGQGMKSKALEYKCAISKAHIAMERGEDRTCLEYLRQALALTREMGFVNIFFTRRPAMSRLLARALEAGIEPEIETIQAKELIQKFRLDPPETASDKSPPSPL